MKSTNYNDLRYSVRKVNDDEIEIRNSMFDGYVRGLIRMFFVGMFFVSFYMNLPYKQMPFYEITSIVAEDFDSVFNLDRNIKPLYKEHIEIHSDPEFIRMFPNDKILNYEEYRKPYIERYKWNRIRFYCHFIWISFVLFLLCLPRARGVRINRKKRVIYAPIIDGKYSVAIVPETGDPLGGLTWHLYGVYPFSLGNRYSLSMCIQDEVIKRTSTHYLGVYPLANKDQNADIIRAVRAFLTEDNPEFLKHIGKHFSVWSLKSCSLAFCNAFAIPVPFRRKKADAAIDAALKAWKRKTIDKKAIILNKIKEEQDWINASILEDGGNNDV